MEGEGGYHPPETQQPEVPVVREGLSAIVLPELGKLNTRSRDFEPVSEQETMDKLNNWLEGLNKQALHERSCYKPQSRCSIRRHFALEPFPVRVFACHFGSYSFCLSM